MSKIKAELLEATQVKAKRNEDPQAFLGRIVTAVAELDDEEWEGLSQEAQDWYNNAADAANSKKQIEGFEEEEEAAVAPARGTRGTRGAAKAAKRDEPEVGMQVTVTTKRGKTTTGEVVEIDAEVIVIADASGDEHEFDRSKLESISPVVAEAPVEEEKSTSRRGAKKEAPADEAAAEPSIEVGTKVVAVTKRGKEYSGEVIEIDGDTIVIDVGGGSEEELDTTKLKTLMIQPPESPKPARSRRSGEAATPAAPAKAPKVTSKDNDGVSVTTRIRELILDDLEATAADIAKAVTKEKLAFKESTLKLIYSEVHRLLDMLKARKMLAARR